MITRNHVADGTRSEVCYSDCHTYRYLLTRQWEASKGDVAFVMLNPSKADEFLNDPTVERCERRARHMGFGGVQIVNIFAFRATDPQVLRRAMHPCGPENDAILSRTAAQARLVIAAWGTHGVHQGRGAIVRDMLWQAGHDLHHLGLTKDGHPRHPLYVPYRQKPQLWRLDLPGTSGNNH